SSRAERGGTREAEAGGGNAVDQRGAGGRPEGAAKAAAYSASYLDAAERGTAGSVCGGVHGAGVCAEAEDRAGAGARGAVRSAKLSMGAGRAGGLVRSIRGGRR